MRGLSDITSTIYIQAVAYSLQSSTAGPEFEHFDGGLENEKRAVTMGMKIICYWSFNSGLQFH
jgi:hypothetical protein